MVVHAYREGISNGSLFEENCGESELIGASRHGIAEGKEFDATRKSGGNKMDHWNGLVGTTRWHGRMIVRRWMVHHTHLSNRQAVLKVHVFPLDIPVDRCILVSLSLDFERHIGRSESLDFERSALDRVVLLQEISGGLAEVLLSVIPCGILRWINSHVSEI